MDKEMVENFIENLYQFHFPIHPQSQERARMGKYGMYIPAKSRAFKKQIQEIVKQEYKEYPLEGPLMIEVTFKFKQAKSNKDLFCVNKSDIDNLLKLLFDSLNKLLFKDDKQIVQVVASKVYDDREGIELNVFELRE